ncbi:MAG: TonB-dependent receptor plug domain-containing protein [Bacteroidota bacterium]
MHYKITHTVRKSAIIFLALLTTFLQKGYSQTDSLETVEKANSSLQQLLNMQVVSVSKKSEDLFNAPLSASVVTGDEITKAGCTSIMEALRLVPGMIVREQTNGNYDIHIRGMNDASPNAPFDGTATTTLVMIDNRPIYNYLRGGTFWETLPVDLNDIERIEVVRGPAAALYGPNAVNGVINIITKKIKNNGIYIIANAKQGGQNTFINNGSLGYRAKNWSMIASGNYQSRERSQDSYYELFRNEWLDHPDYMVGMLGDTTYNFDQRFPDPELAVEKYAGNIFMNYEPARDVNFQFSSGTQHSIAQKVATDNGTFPLSWVSSESHYADLHAGIKQFTAQLSYNSGTQSLTYQKGNTYDFNSMDANVEYNYVRNNFTLKPGISYRSAVYDDTKYSDLLTKTGMFNAKGEITTQSASLRAEYKFFNKKLRLVAGASISKFNLPDTIYPSYELAATYTLNKKHLFRVVCSSSPRSSNIYDAYINQEVSYFQSGYKKYTHIVLEGNKDLKLLTSQLFEVGYRVKLTSQLNMDLEVFNVYSKNFNSLVSADTETSLQGTDTIDKLPIMPTQLPLEQTEQGITLSVNYISRKLQIKPFVTFQQTKIKNYSTYHNTANASYFTTQNMNPAENNIYSAMGTESIIKSTPAIFGGATINYSPVPKFNFNVSSYYFSAQTVYHISNILFRDGIRGVDYIHSKLIINATVSYQALKHVKLFITGKNILNDTSREYFKTDTTPFTILGGVNFELP